MVSLASGLALASAWSSFPPLDSPLTALTILSHLTGLSGLLPASASSAQRSFVLQAVEAALHPGM